MAAFESNVEVVPASQIDYGQHAAFQRAVFREAFLKIKVSDSHLTPEYFRWKYNPPDGEALVGIVRQGNSLLCTGAIQPIKLIGDKGPIQGWQTVDLGTRVEDRSHGLAQRILAALVANTPDGDVLFGFPNKSSTGCFTRVLLNQNCGVTTWINPFPRQRGCRCCEVSESESLPDEFARPNISPTPLKPCVERSSVYLNWRYQSHPVHRYTYLRHLKGGACVGIAILRAARILNREFIIIMELMTERPACLLRHIAAWVARGKGQRSRPMIALLGNAVSLAEVIGAGFLPVPPLFLPKRQYLAIHQKTKSPSPFFAAPWLVQTGDWDAL